MSTSTPPQSRSTPSPTRRQRLRAWFESALDVDPSQREAWIETHVDDATARQEVRRLLASDHAAGPFDVPAESRAARIGPASTMDVQGLVGTRIGVFRIERLLGQGGMSTVFLGRRDNGDFDQHVALKLLRRGLYSEAEQRLFRREQRVLASLSHPHIAHLLDGGITPAGIPYLVIEYIDGTPITEHAAARGLDLRSRLALFVVVCTAVAAAHRALIVHRDLKPANILVDHAGNVKLLDFGIAKLLADEEDETRTGHVALTPGYAAPEQYSGSAISTATDVYGLGVVLRELLTGERPSIPAGRTTSTGKPREPRSAHDPVATRLRGDLATIIDKARDEEPDRRYASARELGDDVERFLLGQPVQAHPPSGWYRARKFMRRHRAGVAFGAAFALALLASLAITLWQAREARLQAVRANTVRDVLVNVFDSARAQLPRDQRPTPEGLVAEAKRQLDSGATLDAETRIDLLRTLADVWLSLSRFDEADRALVEAERGARELGDDAAALAIAVPQADGWQRAGKHAEAIARLMPVLPRLRRGDAHVLLRALGVLAAAKVPAGEPVVALALRREAHAVAQSLYPANSPEVLSAAFEVGHALADNQDFSGALHTLAPAIETWRSSQAPEDDRYVRALSTLAMATDALGDMSGTEKHLREVLDLKKRIYPEGHDAIAKTLRDLGGTLDQSDRHAEGEAMLREALAIQHAVFGDRHRMLVETQVTLGASLALQRRFGEAEQQYQAALAICDGLGLREEMCARARNNLGQVYYRTDRLDDARREMQAALDLRRRLHGDGHVTIAHSLHTLANVRVKAGDYAGGAELYSEALGIFSAAGFGQAREVAHTHMGLAQALHHLGRSEEALGEIGKALATWRAAQPDGHVRELMMLIERAQYERALGREDAKRTTLAEIAALGVADSELAPRSLELLRMLGAPADAP